MDKVLILLKQEALAFILPKLKAFMSKYDYKDHLSRNVQGKNVKSIDVDFLITDD